VLATKPSVNITMGMTGLDRGKEKRTLCMVQLSGRNTCSDFGGATIPEHQ
jgi:hypothetical protein